MCDMCVNGKSVIRVHAIQRRGDFLHKKASGVSFVAQECCRALSVSECSTCGKTHTPTHIYWRSIDILNSTTAPLLFSRPHLFRVGIYCKAFPGKLHLGFGRKHRAF